MQHNRINPSEISLVIPVHKDGPMLRGCLDSVSRLDPQPLEVIVAVDGADNEVLQLLLGYPFRSIPLPEKPGVSIARNTAASMARGRAIAFLDSDIELPRDFVIQAARALAYNPWADAAFGSYNDAPASRSIVSLFRNLLHHHTHQNFSGEVTTFWSGCSVIMTDAFRSVGGFDPLYRHPSIEDVELGHRLTRSGRRIALEKTWQVRHLKSWNLNDMITTDIFYRAVPWSLLLLKNKETRQGLSIGLSQKTSVLLMAFAFACSLAIPFLPAAVLPAIIFLSATVMVNSNFYFFLLRTQGIGLALLSIPLHLLHYACALCGSVLALAAYFASKELKG